MKWNKRMTNDLSTAILPAAALRKAILPMAVLILATVMIVDGCGKKLQQVNPNQQTAQTFWKTSTDAYNAGNSVYGSLILDGSYMRFTHVVLNTRGDDATSVSPYDQIYNCGKFALNVDGFCVQAPFQAFYQGIFRANQVLENVPGIHDGSGSQGAVSSARPISCAGSICPIWPISTRMCPCP